MKKGQKKSFVVIGFVVAVIVIIAAVILLSPHNASAQQTTQNQNTNTGSSSGTLFSSSQYAPYAYLISTPTLSAKAKEALTGFKLSSTKNSDGSTTYTLTALKSGYTNQNYTLQSGEKLYFIERTLRDDDTASDTDYMLGDDMAIVVNANGYIVQ